MHSSSPRSRRIAVALAVPLSLSVGGLAACSGGDSSGVTAECPDGSTEITLSGPNQWTTDGDTFGPAWEDLVASFKKAEPCITLKTNVLPMDSYIQTLSTQLAAGSAPELVFSAANHDPYMVHPLTDELDKPNPYVEGNERWLDLFNPDYFSLDVVANPEGDFEYIPLNLVGVAVFYNQDAFDEAGIAEPPETFEELIDSCDALTDAGYIPYAMDNGETGIGWTIGALTAQFLAGEPADEWDVYDAAGDPGNADPLPSKSIARAMATGEFNTSMPEVQEALTETERMWDHCVSPDWSGLPASSGMVGGQQFPAGEAAMSIGTNFSVALLDDADFEFGTMPFPTVTTDTTDLVTGEPARFGTGVGGTSYMIPSTVEGDKYDAALKFLQFVSTPDNIRDWLASSGGVPVLTDVEPDETIASFLEGDWAKPFRVSYGVLQMPSTTTNVNAFSGFLLGKKDLAKQTSDLQALYDERVQEDGRNHTEWADEDWLKKD